MTKPANPSMAVLSTALILALAACSNEPDTLPALDWATGPVTQFGTDLEAIGEIKFNPDTGEFASAQCQEMTQVATDARAQPLPDHADLAQTWAQVLDDLDAAASACADNDSEEFIERFTTLGEHIREVQGLVGELPTP